MGFVPNNWVSGDLISAAKANNTDTQFAQSVKYSEINRQTVIQSAVSSVDGTADFITGSTSALTAFATASTGDPLILSFANGNSSLGGLNYDIQLTTVSSWTGLNASNTSFLFFETSTAGVVTSSHTIIPPQYGSYFDNTQNSLIHFDGTAGSTSVTDNYGNTWTNYGTAVLSTAQIKFGTTSLTLPGSSNSYVETTNFTSFGGDGWTLEGWFYMNSTGDYRTVISSVNLYGFNLYYNKLTGHLNLSLAGSTSANNIASDSSGTTTIASSAWTKWSLDYNSSTYTLMVNGLSDLTVTSTLIVNGQLGGVRFGLNASASDPFSGYIDEFRYTKGACRYVAAYIPESSAFTGDVHFFDTNKMKMYYGDPTAWVEKIRLFVGEAVTDGTIVSSVVTYALKGEYRTTFALTAPGTLTQSNANIGTMKINVTYYAICKIAENGYVLGNKCIPLPREGVAGDYSTPISLDSRNVINFTTGSSVTASGMTAINKTTGAGFYLAIANWDIEIIAKRTF